MSESWDKGQKPLELPNPELNPLQNPTLGKNLGRWAQVYFTSPPEKREQAVVDLLRELESETGPRAPRLEPSLPLANPVAPRLICGVCQQPNDLDQRFCGLCGAPLRSEDAPRPSQPIEAPPENRREAVPSVSPAAATMPESDLEWLREKSLSRLSDPEEPSGKWKYALIVLIVVAAAFGTLQWVSNRPPASNPQPAASTSPVQTAPPTQAVTPVQPQAAPTKQAPATAQSEPPIEKKPARVETSSATDHDMQSARVMNNSPQPSVTPASVNTPALSAAEGGAQELNLARGYLDGKHGVRDPSEAAKWLWKAVAKQNSTADVLLGELYMNGDGVSKSCAQARLLLSAAAQKGQPGAAEKVQQLESSGCR